MLTVEGFHVPDTPLFEVVGRTGAVAPLQMGAGVVNAGIICDVTETVSDAVVAQSPVVGVNV